MSESSSDTESSCGWTIISNEGSDIETLGPECGADGGPEVSARTPALEQAASLCAEGSEGMEGSCLDATLTDSTMGEAETRPKAGEGVAVDEHVTLCSSSDQSDIMTLGDSREGELGPWEEPAERAVEEEEEDAGDEDLYLGTSSSSQYTFSTSETTVLPVEPPAQRDSSSSSSGDEAEREVSPTLRRRRVRRSTAGSEPEEQPQAARASQEEQEQEPEVPEQQDPRAAPQHHISSTLNKCILLALVIAISMGFGHFYGTAQIQERQRIVEKTRGSELSERAELRPCQKGQDGSKEVIENLRGDLEAKQHTVQSITGIMDKITKENQQLRKKETKLQAEREHLFAELKQARSEMDSRQQSLSLENLQLKSSLEREEESLSTLRDELRHLRAQIRQLEDRGAEKDSVLSENQRLKEHLQQEKVRARGFLSQRETLVAEAQALRRQLDEERRVTDRLREELREASSQKGEDGGQADPETEELQDRLQDLEKKLSFEQQRSDLWERLYVESKEERAKGDGQGSPKDGMIGKMKETFDAVKNSTKEFVHHHKEQIKKAKEAVKENLRKFSDSVKSTFRHFKDSASHVFNKNRRAHDRKYNERKDPKAEHREQHQEQQQQFTGHRYKPAGSSAWQTHKPLHQHPRKFTDSYQTQRNVHRSETQGRASAKQKGCSGVFDCAYQESMSLFNKAMDPIRADEFNQLLQSYLQQSVGHFHHWTELESFINNFFHNGVFIHDQMLFTDFVSGVEDYLEDMDEYNSHNDVFEDLDDFIYRHLFGDTYSEHYGPSRPFQGPKNKADRGARHQRSSPRARPCPQRERKWSRPSRSADGHMADVKIELGPMPFDPKY